MLSVRVRVKVGVGFGVMVGVRVKYMCLLNMSIKGPSLKPNPEAKV